MTEKIEDFIPVETWMRSQNLSGFPTIVGQILGHLEFDSLINCRQVSKTFKNFLDDKTFWIACLDEVRIKYLDKLLMKSNSSMVKCYGVLRMSPEETRVFKNDNKIWIRCLEMIKAEGSIEDLINVTKLMKQSEEWEIFFKFCGRLTMSSAYKVLATIDYVGDGEIQGQYSFKKTKERACIPPSLHGSSEITILRKKFEFSHFKQ